MRTLAAGLAAAALAAAMVPQPAHAEFGLVPGGFKVTALDAGGQPELRAGVSPDRLVASFEFLTDGGAVDENVKDVTIDFPPGFAGYGTAVSTCSRSALVTSTCPPESEVGMMRLDFLNFVTAQIPIYNVVPEEHAVSEFGGRFLTIPFLSVTTLRANGDFGMRVELRDLFQNLTLASGELELWGVPADHQTNTTVPRRPLLRSPTRCEEPLTTWIRVRSWQQPENLIGATSTASGPLTGCEDLPFDPGLGVTLDSPDADSPTGTGIELTVPQSDGASARAASHVRDAVVTLPEGMSLSPAVAQGLMACDDDQIGIGSTLPPACPESSKIGSLEMMSSALDEPLEGDLFFGRQTVKGIYRLFVTAAGPGFVWKASGALQANPWTGQLTAVLTDLPQFPMARLALRFKGGPRAPLATPPSCGTGTAIAQLTPYRGPPAVTVAAPVAITSGPDGGACPLAAPFAPTFIAGSSPVIAGDDSAFSLTVRRPDGDEAIERLRVVLPPGVTARLPNVERCPMPVATAAACSADSRVGSVVVEVGSGPSPFPLSGDVYLTGPYRGAPFGVAFTLHGKAGPLDFGMIVVPAALRVDPFDGHLTISTDALPTILEGIPLRLQTLGADIDRPGFMVNPTSCRRGKITASIRGAIATISEPTVSYSLQGCGRLRFRPTVSVALSGRRELRRRGHPYLRIVVHQRAEHANVRAASIALPRAVELNPDAQSVICSREEARDDRCPGGSRVGAARVRTPLFAEPLSGPIHLVQPEGSGTPDLWATVSGGGVRLTLRSVTIARRGDPLRAEFVGLPDLPMSAFSFQLRGDHRGVLSVVEGLCRRGRARPLVAHSAMRGQNDARSFRVIRVRAHPRCGRRQLPADSPDVGSSSAFPTDVAIPFEPR